MKNSFVLKYDSSFPISTALNDVCIKSTGTT